TSRDQTAYYYVLFQALQIVALAGNGSFGKNTRGLLERRSRDEAFRCQRGLGDTEQYAIELGWLFAFSTQTDVFSHDACVFDLFTFDERRITHFKNFNFTQHLTHDYFDVLVVDAYALQTVNVLHFVDDVLRQRFHALEAEDVVRAGRTVRYHLAFLDELTFEHRHLTPFRDEHFVVRAAINRVDAVSRRNDETTLAFGFLAEA